MNELDESHLQPYREVVKRLGADAPGYQSALWGSRETQVMRFQVMLDLADFNQCTVLDVGCGTGDLGHFLLEQGALHARYIGVDAVEQLIAAAKERNLPRSEFHILNVLKSLDCLDAYEADYIVMSGTLNTMDDQSAQNVVRAAFDAAAQGVVFNFLSDRPDAKWLSRDLTPARRFNTVKWLDWALTLTPRVSFTQAYLNGHDATVLLQH